MDAAISTFWLMIANCLIWVGIGSYLAYLGLKQKQLAKQLRQLELTRHDN